MKKFLKAFKEELFDMLEDVQDGFSKLYSCEWWFLPVVIPFTPIAASFIIIMLVIALLWFTLSELCSFAYKK